MKLESRYDIGDEVWVMNGNRPVKCRVKSIFFFTGESLISTEGVRDKVSYTLSEVMSGKEICRSFEEGDRNNRIFTDLDSLLDSL